MTTWKDGGTFRGLWQEVVDEDDANICMVWINRRINHEIVSWPEGEANFRLILQAPKMLEALEEMQAAMSTILSILSYLPTAADDLLGASTARQVKRAVELSEAILAAVKGESDETG